MRKASLTTHGAGVLCFFDQKVLLVQMNYGKFAGQWILPGGMLEANEHPHQAAKREVKEETNLDIEIRKLLAVRHRLPNDDRTANTFWVFSGLITNENPESLVTFPKDELLDAKFWDINEAKQSKYVRPHTQKYIELGLGKSDQALVEFDGPDRNYCYSFLGAPNGNL